MRTQDQPQEARYDYGLFLRCHNLSRSGTHRVESGPLSQYYIIITHTRDTNTRNVIRLTCMSNLVIQHQQYLHEKELLTAATTRAGARK